MKVTFKESDQVGSYTCKTWLGPVEKESIQLLAWLHLAEDMRNGDLRFFHTCVLPRGTFETACATKGLGFDIDKIFQKFDPLGKVTHHIAPFPPFSADLCHA